MKIEQKLEKYLKNGEFLVNPRVSVKLDIDIDERVPRKRYFRNGSRGKNPVQ